jgi:hypothetical protein
LTYPPVDSLPLVIYPPVAAPVLPLTCPGLRDPWPIFGNILPNFLKMCCYSGTGLNTGLSARSGFLYDSKNVKDIINSG